LKENGKQETKLRKDSTTVKLVENNL
jgi:hypothetical protein